MAPCVPRFPGDNATPKERDSPIQPIRPWNGLQGQLISSSSESLHSKPPKVCERQLPLPRTRLAQLIRRLFRPKGVAKHLLQAVGSGLGHVRRQDLEVPVEIILQGIPVLFLVELGIQVRRRVKDQMKRRLHRLQAPQDRFQEARKLELAIPRTEVLFKGTVVAGGKDPCFIRHPGGKRTEGNKLVVPLNRTNSVRDFLVGHIAEDTPFFECVMEPVGSQLVDRPPGDERCGRNL